jgi:hypothetical protein
VKKTISIALSLILLLSNVGFTMGTHFCGGHAVISELMIGEEHLDCGMAMVEKSVSDKLSISAPNCCANQYLSPSTDDAEKKDAKINSTISVEFLAFAFAIYRIDSPSTSTPSSFLPKDPPLPDLDFQSVHQVFLI